ncbi:MAG: hypothetical protein ABIP94_18530, partial [Planctomycetota bacterium]
MKTPFLPVTFLVLGGCATSYTEPPLAIDHPGNPAAQETPLPEGLSTLDLAKTEAVSGPTAPEAQAPSMEGGHKHEAPT